jgi:general secretion pathway protein N
MRWPVAVTLGLISYLFFLIYSLPVQQVLGWVGFGNGQTLTLEGASGSVWTGEARQVIYQQQAMGQLKWDFHPSRLLLGKLAYGLDLKDTGQQLQGTLVSGFGERYQVVDISALFLASRLRELLPKQQINLEGKIQTEELDLTFENGRLMAAEGRVQWLDGALQSPMSLPIGDLQAEFSTDEESGDILGQIRDLKGSIAIQAEVRLKPDGNFQFNGKLKPGDEADPGLSGALQAIGRRQADGSIQLNYAGRI